MECERAAYKITDKERERGVRRGNGNSEEEETGHRNVKEGEERKKENKIKMKTKQ